MIPHCPYCQAKAPQCLGLQQFNQIGLVFCNDCGAIFGVVSLPSPSSKKVETPAEKPAPKIEISIDTVEKPHPKIEVTPPPGPALAGDDDGPKKVQTGTLEYLGSTDLSGKVPYNPEAIANRMKAAGMAGSRFLRIAVDDGPPMCPQHKVEMVKTVIPEGYKNSGRELWMCPQFKSCRQWELAK